MSASVCATQARGQRFLALFGALAAMLVLVGFAAVLSGPPATPMLGKDASRSAHAADLYGLARLARSSPGALVQLAEGRYSAAELLHRLPEYRTLLLVTAGSGSPQRRAEDQPYISIAGQDGDGATGSGADGLAALTVPLAAMNAAAVGVERVLGRRLFPITLSLFERGALGGGAYAVFDASSGQLLLDRGVVSRTWGSASSAAHQIAFVTTQLADRLMERAAVLLPLLPGARVAGRDASADERGYHAEAAGAAGAAAVSVQAEAQVEGTAAAVMPQHWSGAQQQQHQHQQQPWWRTVLRGSQPANVPHGAGTDGADTDGAAASGVAAAALNVLAVAAAAALPAAFAAAPPLWFCILCPSVLGLLAPLLINVALNQLAGALCAQMQLTDDQCFDVLLGALGAGFVLSLASAIPIFFVCRLPECAGRNVTAALAARR